MYPAQKTAKRVHLSPRRRQDQRPTIDRIILHTSDFIEIVPVAAIRYVQADGNYCRFFLKGGQQLLISRTLGSFDKHLADHGFLRCHQSYLVNRSEVTRIRKTPHHSLCLGDGTEIPVSRAKQKEVVELLIENS